MMIKGEYEMITSEEINKYGACAEGSQWFESNFPKGVKLDRLIRTLCRAFKWDWAWWYLRKILTKEQSIKIAIYAAKQVIDIYEKKYPKDDRPRKAIEAAKEYLKNPSSAACAANAANAAANAADAADAAANAADAAARATAYAADAADAANAAARAAAYDADAAYAAALKTKILKYAIKIIGGAK